MKQRTRVLAAVLGPVVLLALIVALIFIGEGIQGFKPFFNLEALLLVFGGTFLLLWSSHPLREIFLQPTPRMIAHAADCAITLGVTGTILGFILMLADISDVTEVPRRIAFAMTSLVYGLVLAEIILAPIGHRLQRSAPASSEGDRPPSAGKRRFLAFLGVGAVLVSLFAVLYALTTALRPQTRIINAPASASSAPRQGGRNMEMDIHLPNGVNITCMLGEKAERWKAEARKNRIILMLPIRQYEELWRLSRSDVVARGMFLVDMENDTFLCSRSI